MVYSSGNAQQCQERAGQIGAVLYEEESDASYTRRVLNTTETVPFIHLFTNFAKRLDLLTEQAPPRGPFIPACLNYLRRKQPV